MKHFLPKQSFQAILTSFQELGLESGVISESFFEEGGIKLDQLGIVASVDTLMLLWDIARRQSSEEHLFIRAGLALPFGSFGVVDHLVSTSATLEEGLRNLQTFLPLISSTTSLVFEESDDWVDILIVNTPYFSIHHYVDQWLLGMFVSYPRQFLGDDLPVEHLYLRPLKEPSASLDALLGAPVYPDQTRTGMRVSKEVWLRELPSADPLLNQSLFEAAEELKYRQFSSSPLAYAVWNTFSDALASGQSITSAIADQLGMSSRTLQRRLRKEDSSLSDLLDTYRKQEAIRLVTEGARSLADIAYELGYNEQSSFNRAFRRWMGVSPRSWLQRFSS